MLDSVQHIKKIGQKFRLPGEIYFYDAKCNNVLFDRKTKEPIVIDLDTIMPGMPMYDFEMQFASLLILRYRPSFMRICLLKLVESACIIPVWQAFLHHGTSDGVCF